jgi:hypothetical protein
LPYIHIILTILWHYIMYYIEQMPSILITYLTSGILQYTGSGLAENAF